MLAVKEWVGIDEQQPEVGQRVLVFDERAEDIVVATWDHVLVPLTYEKGELKFFFDIDDEPPIVKYWAPLPKSPYD